MDLGLNHKVGIGVVGKDTLGYLSCSSGRLRDIPCEFKVLKYSEKYHREVNLEAHYGTSIVSLAILTSLHRYTELLGELLALVLMKVQPAALPLHVAYSLLIEIRKQDNHM